MCSDRENFWRVCLKTLISHIVHTLWRVQEVESYALSKIHAPTMIGDHQNVEKTIRKTFDLLGSQKSIFRCFPRFGGELDGGLEHLPSNIKW